jgi:hypothetical protein
MTGKEIFLNALQRKKNPRPAIGNPVSIACTELMDKVGAPYNTTQNSDHWLS